MLYLLVGCLYIAFWFKNQKAKHFKDGQKAYFFALPAGKAKLNRTLLKQRKRCNRRG